MKGVVQTPWSDEERAMLRRLRANGVSIRQAGVMMGRTEHSVQRQCRYLGLNLPAKPKAAKPASPRRVRAGSTLPPLASLTAKTSDE